MLFYIKSQYYSQLNLTLRIAVPLKLYTNGCKFKIPRDRSLKINFIKNSTDSPDPESIGLSNSVRRLSLSFKRAFRRWKCLILRDGQNKYVRNSHKKYESIRSRNLKFDSLDTNYHNPKLLEESILKKILPRRLLPKPSFCNNTKLSAHPKFCSWILIRPSRCTKKGLKKGQNFEWGFFNIT